MTTFNFVPTFTKLWLFLSTVICIWDASFVLLRPRTFPGGDLHVFWKPYALYIEIDKLYSDLSDQFVFNQSILNLYECFINVVALCLLFSKCQKTQLGGTFLAILVNAFTFWKTVLYFQYGLPHCLPVKNYVEFIFLYIIPNGFWIFVPLINCISISKRISQQLLTQKTQQPEKQREKIKQS
ncbi:emopamil-binding protein (macronuclear) [Tetrahymena thermophila SB210]|uniref:Emopamil-binding protein n=1 Tax=Tetrahymena thermophila (strain SB210) TaxID=312017 RepID=W7XJ40_TETTS|nr:emopamil-binding protein [Tetrahymena thermophila SB210]EWS75186.1 emopamil-binding protein [Tetrahymena thermophila SB210]|eukprot:XP_012652177.1 emopamil-binding protein [Tetrahymena thermophila SB210]